MPIIKGIEVAWVRCDRNNPSRYQNRKDAPAKWSVQLRVHDKATAQKLKTDYGFDFKPDEVDNKIFYKTSISRFAFRPDANGKEDPENPNTPVNVILGNGTPLDPNTVGNGSIANISFTVKDDKSSRNLVGIQVIKHVVFERSTDTDFELTDDFEVIESEEKKNDLDDEIPF